MIPADIKILKKLINKTLDKGHVNLKDSHEKIVNNTIYNLAIHDVLDLLESVENGTIGQSEIKSILDE